MMLQSKFLRSYGLVLLMLAVGIAVSARANNYVYSNNDLPVTNGNTVSAYSVGADGTLTEISGSPFATNGTGAGGGYFASRRIAVWGNLLFASNGGSNSVSVFSIDPATGNLTAVPGSPFSLSGVTAGSGISLAVSPDGKYLFTGSYGITVQSIAANGALTQLASYSILSNVDTVAVSPDGRFLAWTDTYRIGIYTIALDGSLTAAPGSPLPNTVPALPTGVEFTPDNSAGNRLYVGYATSTTRTIVSAFDVAGAGGLTAITGSPFTFNVGVNPNNIAISPDGKYLFAASQEYGDVSPTVLSIATDGTLSLAQSPGISAAPQGEGMNIAISADKSFLYSGSFGGPVYDFNIGAGEALSSPHAAATIYGFGSAYSVAAYSPQFAGTPGTKNCKGKSISALANTYGGLAHAAATLGYASVKDLQGAVAAYCGE